MTDPTPAEEARIERWEMEHQTGDPQEDPHPAEDWESHDD